MKLIVAEKAIAGERIAELLANGPVKKLSVSGARVFEFDWKNEKVRLIPLRGHISEVDFPASFSRWKGIDVRELIDAPIRYVETELSIINALRDSAPLANEIIIATDADREGESIGLEAINYVKQSNKDIVVRRALFSAIIKEDIEKSFNELEKFDYNLAYSADARREIDLIWGSVLTRFLSLITGRVGNDFLSVGRVQTPTLALIVDREKERLNFKPKKYWEIVATCEKDKQIFEAFHQEGKFWDELKAKEIFSKNPKSAIVRKVSSKVKVLKKPIPFNTTEFLRAATGIGFSAGKAMNIAESLYQKGFISYPRTDNSVYPSNLDLKQILNKLVSVKALQEDVLKILAMKSFSPSRGKETKDHPPIHPVSAVQKEMLSVDEWKIYELVVRRFLATLASDAKTENVSVLLDADNESYVSTGQTILEPGWKAFYPYSKLEERELPKLKENDVVKIRKLDLLEKETQPPGRYSQGSLIKLMEEHNLGTKSTRPEIIQKLYSRKYISGNKSIEPSKVAFALIDSLEKHSNEITKPKMTADLEKQMDEIAAGKNSKENVVNNSRKNLRKLIDSLFKEKDAIASDLRSALKDDSVIGNCPKCSNGLLIVRVGKSGKRFAGCNNYPECVNSFPLPQKGTIIPTKELCPECKMPIIIVKNGNNSYKMCITMDCKTKAHWGKKVVVEKESKASEKKLREETKSKIKEVKSKS